MRERICLNGEWNFSPDYSGKEPQDMIKDGCAWEKQTVRVPSSWRWSIDPKFDYQPYDLFNYPMEWNNAQAGILNRKIYQSTPEGKRAFLLFNGVLQRSVVFLNDQLIGSETEAYLPFEYDITDMLANGAENDLKVWCGTIEKEMMPMGLKCLAPNGSWFAGMARGIWQDVFIEYRSPVWFDAVLVKTSTRHSKVEYRAEVHSSEGSGNGWVHASIWYGDEPVKDLKSIQVAWKEGETITVNGKSSWGDALLWSPEHPHLYTLKVYLEVDGLIIDEKETRFGFREVWIDGHNIYLNGVRINLRGDAWHYQGFVQQNQEFVRNWYRTCKQTGINFLRLHAMPYPEFYLDVADEMGMLIVDESAIYGSSKATFSDHPKFLENCKRHLQKLVRRDHNHPSIIIWSMQNEMRWVDGRDGYKAAMPGLTKVIKEIDNTRPVSYDGDNRLVNEADMEIVSMHYNIDGTVESWSKKKPLIFGEHGAWHYVSPQTCTHLVGQAAYLSYEACEESIGLFERYFIEYARCNDVTGITPFNTAYYTLTALPEKELLLDWDELSTPGVKPKRIPPYTLTINNGMLKDDPLFKPNPSWKHMAAAFKPVTIFRNEYNTTSYGSVDFKRSFSVYNDTEKEQVVRLIYTFSKTGNPSDVIDQGKIEFQQKAGERYEWKHTFSVPKVECLTTCTLKIDLYHRDRLVEAFSQDYKIYPEIKPIDHLDGKRVAYLGEEPSYSMLKTLVSNLELIDEDDVDFSDWDVLVVGANYTKDFRKIQQKFECFVKKGGFLLILEQKDQALGDLQLSKKPFYQTFISEANHPVFSGLQNDDLGMWGEENIITGADEFIVKNAFDKPVLGDFKILLECGMGDFGWGGLYWTPLIEYSIGAGKILLSQVDILKNFNKVPQAGMLLANMLRYALAYSARSLPETAGLLGDNQPLSELCTRIGLAYQSVKDLGQLPQLVITSGNDITPEQARKLNPWVIDGGKIIVLCANEDSSHALSALIGEDLKISQAPVYQVQPLPSSLTACISPLDVYGIEKVTYTPGTYSNRLVCQNSISIDNAEPLFSNVHAPWVPFFIEGKDAEYHKVAIATMSEKAISTPKFYGYRKTVGKGEVIFCQVTLEPENLKVCRFYSRFLANAGASIQTTLLQHIKKDTDYGIEAMMALPVETYQPLDKMETYFFDTGYTLNNLGEGVYGWMKRVEKVGGEIIVPASSHKTYFMTAFVESEINRDPSQRATDVLPDPSIVPDLYIKTNCPVKLYLNGKCYLDRVEPVTEGIKIEDVLLHQGTNRLALECQGGGEDITLSLWFLNKFGDPLTGIKTILTLD